MAEAIAAQSFPDASTIMTSTMEPSHDATAFENISTIEPTNTPDLTPAQRKYTIPLYTEINIPLPLSPPPKGTQSTPNLPVSTSSAPTTPGHSKHRAHSLHSFSPFHRRRSSSPSTALHSMSEEDSSNIVQEKRIELSMRAVGKGGRKRRSGTVDAAIVPAVLVLSAELFTPGEGDRKVDGMDRLEISR